MNNGVDMPMALLKDQVEEFRYGTSVKSAPNGIPTLRIPNVVGGRLDLSDMKCVPVDDAELHRLRLREGDVLFVRTNGNPDFVGRSAIVTEAALDQFGIAAGDVVYASYLIRARLKVGKFDARFLQHYLLSSDGRRALRERCRTSARQYNINIDGLGSLCVPMPSLPEQKRIADILDKADDIRRKRRSVESLIDELPHAMFFEYFGEPRLNCKKWPMRIFSDVCESRLGKMLDARQQTGDHPRPYLRNLNVQWGRLDLSKVFEMDFDEADRREFRLQPGDVMVCEGGAGVGQTAIWRGELSECYFQKSLHRVRPRTGLAIPEYIAHLIWVLMRTDSILGSISQATIPHLTGVKLKALEIPLPPLSIQESFAGVLQKVGAINRRIEASIAESEALFDSLVHRAFRGEL